MNESKLVKWSKHERRALTEKADCSCVCVCAPRQPHTLSPKGKVRRVCALHTRTLSPAYIPQRGSSTPRCKTRTFPFAPHTHAFSHLTTSTGLHSPLLSLSLALLPLTHHPTTPTATTWDACVSLHIHHHHHRVFPGSLTINVAEVGHLQLLPPLPLSDSNFEPHR